VLFQSDVEQLIGKRPFEEKKVLDVDGDPSHHSETGSISEGVPPYDSSITNHPATS
jgi:cell division protease FtsH